MEVVAFVAGTVQIGVIAVAAKQAPAPQRRVLVTVAGAGLALLVLALLVLAAPTFYAEDVARWAEALGGVAVWLLYIAGGVAVVAGIVMALRGGGATRFAWRQGKYHKYRSYRRI